MGVRTYVAAAVLAVTACAPGAAATAPQVPAKMIGTWAKGGQCTVASSRLVIAKTTVTLGTAKPQKIVYVPNDDGAGHGAIHWAQEGNVDNFVYAAGKDAIVHNVQGYHMPGAVLYQRCKS
jgi:hypothetical protein